MVGSKMQKEDLYAAIMADPDAEAVFKNEARKKGDWHDLTTL
jgi:hypothetical protein